MYYYTVDFNIVAMISMLVVDASKYFWTYRAAMIIWSKEKLTSNYHAVMKCMFKTIVWDSYFTMS